MSIRRGTIRRGPTMRGGYRLPGGDPSARRQPSLASRRHQNAQEEEEEEFIALNHSLGGAHDFDDDHVEMTPIDIEKDPTTYHHGNETFGDVLTHPVEELQAHRKRREDFEGRQRKIKSGYVENTLVR